MASDGEREPKSRDRVANFRKTTQQQLDEIEEEGEQQQQRSKKRERKWSVKSSR